MTMIGYARVSTTSQNLATQKSLLARAGVTEIRSEKISGVAAKRLVLARLLEDLGAGDVLVVTKLDRLARSNARPPPHRRADSQEGAGLKSLGEAWADTTSPVGKLMITVLGGVAEFERDLILQRTNEGRPRAKAEGKPFGRRPKLTSHQAREALRRVDAGESTREIALSYAVAHSTIVRRRRALRNPLELHGVFRSHDPSLSHTYCRSLAMFCKTLCRCVIMFVLLCNLR